MCDHGSLAKKSDLMGWDGMGWDGILPGEMRDREGGSGWTIWPRWREIGGGAAMLRNGRFDVGMNG